MRSVILAVLFTTLNTTSLAQEVTSKSGADNLSIPSTLPVNPLIDAEAFMNDTSSALALRQTRLLSETSFVLMSREPNTIVLDARSSERFRQAHMNSAINLPFTEFSIDALAKIIPNKNTRILIYCNNNIDTEPNIKSILSPTSSTDTQLKNVDIDSEAMRTAFFGKSRASPLNLPTYASLYSYGYRNVYELGVAVDPLQTQLKFEGELITSTTQNALE
jgi:hypothetical protein